MAAETCSAETCSTEKVRAEAGQVKALARAVEQRLPEPAELGPRDIAAACSWHQRLATLGALGALLGVDALSKLVGFSRLHGFVRRFPIFSPRSRPFEAARIAAVCSAVDRASIYYFKRAWCLQRSVTTTCLLRLAGLPAELVIGLHRMPFYAHAWSEIDQRVVNDHSIVHQRYRVIERC